MISLLLYQIGLLHFSYKMLTLTTFFTHSVHNEKEKVQIYLFENTNFRCCFQTGEEVIFKAEKVDPCFTLFFPKIRLHRI